MSDKKVIGKSMAFKIIQNTGEFYVTPVPISIASGILSINTADWDNQSSRFIGINREVNQKHKKDILAALESRSIILPNSIIAYIEHDYFSFSEIPRMKTDFYTLGEVTFYKSISKGPDSRTAVILDGQHRFTALSEYNRGKGEDFPLYVVFFHEPDPKDQKAEECEKLCLNVMSQVNKSLPLSASEDNLIIARTKEVASNSKIKEFVTLVVNELDSDPKCPLKYQFKSKKPSDKKKSWLKLSVWVNTLTNSFNDRHNPRILQAVWGEVADGSGTINSTSWQVKICVDMIKNGLKALYGLCSDYWEEKTSKQRFYHNVGIRSLISIIDTANATEELFSRDPASHFNRKVPDHKKVIMKLQVALYPIKKINWTANKLHKGSMIEVKQQQEIDKNFSANLCQLINEYGAKRKEWEDTKSTSSFSFDFTVRNTNAIEIFSQKIKITHAEYNDIKNTIENGDFLNEYKIPTPPEKKEKQKAKNKKKRKK